MVRRFRLSHAGGSSKIRAGTGALAAAREEMAGWVRGRRAFTLSSAEVRALHGTRLDALLEGAADRIDLEVPDGEAAKTLRHAERLWEEMAAAGGKRDSRLITLGGGTVGDVGGFVASAFLRGIEYAQIPTTLLAQVDASIGGKTGVNLEAGKNLVGTLHQPRWVIADPRVLETLSLRQLRAGMIEVVKIALACDSGLFEALERSADQLAQGALEPIGEVVPRAIDAKIAVVEKDVGEPGRRRVLNLGHTLGHALETADGYRTLLHGEAVAWGLRFALRLASNRGLDDGVRQRTVALLTRFPVPPLPPLSVDAVLDLMARDKKGREEGLVWVLPRKIGAVEMASDLSMNVVRRELERFIAAESERT